MPLATILAPLATTSQDPPPLATACHRPPNCERSNGPDLAERTLYLTYYAPKQAIPAENPIRSPPLAAARPLIILSWPEALNASGSKRACRMAISRNACSLVALPDFPELAQAVRYGVT